MEPIEKFTSIATIAGREVAVSVCDRLERVGVPHILEHLTTVEGTVEFRLLVPSHLSQRAYQQLSALHADSGESSGIRITIAGQQRSGSAHPSSFVS